ncbi:hypothetical protein P7C73_g4092, partial [Tremellales sp. Uapishka_1]
MSVISKNPFDLLGDNSPPSSPAPAKATPAPAAAPAKAIPGSQAPRTQSQGQRGGRGSSRGAARPPRGDRNGTSDEQPITESAEGFEGERVSAPKRHHNGPDAHTKGPRGTRPDKYATGGHRRGAGPGAGGKTSGGGERRQFERRSGGLPDSQKKIESGWGAEEGTAELTAEVEGENDAQAEETAPGTPAETKAAEPTPEAPVEPEEPEEVTKSYDEYLAELAAKNLGALGKKEGRKVEGETLEGKAFRREAVADFYNGKEKTSAPKTKAPKKEKVFLEFEGKFAPPAGSRPPRGDGDRPDRGGRGGARGSGRGGPRGGRGAAAAGTGAPRGGRGGFGGKAAAPVLATDEKAFPALGA